MSQLGSARPQSSITNVEDAFEELKEDCIFSALGNCGHPDVEVSWLECHICNCPWLGCFDKFEPCK